MDSIKNVCLHSQQTDVADLMQTIRAHPHFRMHSPQLHAMLPADPLTALRNNGHPVTDEQITTTSERGQTVAGGACAFLGVCGAAIGVGIAVFLLQKTTPYDGGMRQTAQRLAHTTLRRIASFDAICGLSNCTLESQIFFSL